VAASIQRLDVCGCNVLTNKGYCVVIGASVDAGHCFCLVSDCCLVRPKLVGFWTSMHMAFLRSLFLYMA